MLKDSKAFSSFSVNDVAAAKKFYGDTLGLDVSEMEEGGMPLLELRTSGSKVMVYPKDDHQPATFTVLNFTVADVEDAVRDLKARRVTFEIYKDGPVKTDDRGIYDDGNGPKIAWFKDPAGNILSVLEEPA